MCEINACNEVRFSEVIDLINRTFRPGPKFKPTMEKEYPLLLNKENFEHMRVIIQDNKPVANVNFYNSEILVEGVPIKVASVGAVCTDIDYRGRGYSTKMLDNVEQLMLEENVKLMIVSGVRSLYLRRGCVKVGTAYLFKVKSEKLIINDIKIIEYSENDFNKVVNLYNKDNTRYYRSYEQFKSLFDACYNYGSASIVKAFLIEVDNKCKGYILVNFYYNEDSTYAIVKECAGEPSMIYEALQNITHQYLISYTQVVGVEKSNMANVMLDLCDDYETVNIAGTIKILDFVGLMQDLKQYFRQYVTTDILEVILFEEKDGKYIIKINDEILQIETLEVLTKVIFGDNKNTLEEILGISLNNNSMVKKFLETVFPLPFPWTENINFQ